MRQIANLRGQTGADARAFLAHLITPQQTTAVSARTVGWMGILRGHRAKPLEWLAEKMIFLVSLAAIATIFLIFVFVGREALPIVLGRTSSAAAVNGNVIPPQQIDRLSQEQLRAYLRLSPQEFLRMDREALMTLMELKAALAKEAPTDPDANVNTTGWRYLLWPYQWTGHDRPVYIWQPSSEVPKYNIIPLVVGSLKTTLTALVFSVPLALGAALFVSQLLSPRLKEWVKPGIELLAGIPSVVVGAFALVFMAPLFQKAFGTQTLFSALLAGVALGFAMIPIIFSIAEDALTSVPKSYIQAALALGSSKWQAAWRIVLPAALPGVFAAVVLGFGRAFGETMIVLIASGNASIMSWSIFDSTRTIPATIAAEVLEAVRGGPHYRMLFLIGALLFLVTFVSNLIGEMVVDRLKHKLEGKV
ncbi:MAG: phosphate ABC transporter permease subunit PstC [Verrucomicrobiales bacterium]|nr:phosphate ABC transporter permease subunit PstC [Verrucomicrobiales bacterium]